MGSWAFVHIMYTRNNVNILVLGPSLPHGCEYNMFGGFKTVHVSSRPLMCVSYKAFDCQNSNDYGMVLMLH